jgi:tryptophan synthase alpha chain
MIHSNVMIQTNVTVHSRITQLFDRLRAEKRPALIAYITAGDPSPSITPDLVAALERGGADLIELGVPFSDPIADGPVIQRGSDRALQAGTKLATVLDIASQVRKRSEIPLLLFTYMNPVLRYGLEPLARAAVASGIDGCLLTDLSVEEAEPYIHVMRKAGLDTVFLAAPTSSQRRLELVAKYSTGFVYLVSRTGVTGERSSVSDNVGPLVANMRRVTPLPLAVGFGISTADQVRSVGAVADGVVVGSAFERVIEENATLPDLPVKIEALARKLAGGLLSKNQ